VHRSVANGTRRTTHNRARRTERLIAKLQITGHLPDAAISHERRYAGLGPGLERGGSSSLPARTVTGRYVAVTAMGRRPVR
jgi:hypothetical protein